MVTEILPILLLWAWGVICDAAQRSFFFPADSDGLACPACEDLRSLHWSIRPVFHLSATPVGPQAVRPCFGDVRTSHRLPGWMEPAAFHLWITHTLLMRLASPRFLSRSPETGFEVLSYRKLSWRGVQLEVIRQQYNLAGALSCSLQMALGKAAVSPCPLHPPTLYPPSLRRLPYI